MPSVTVKEKEMFVEETILGAVKRFLAGRVNELLGEMECAIPPVEFGNYRGGSTAVGACGPAITLSACERTEKERIIRLDVYSLTITFTVPEHPEGERNCYAYAAAVDKALREDPTLGGTASRAVITGKKYVPPKTPHCGEGWTVMLTLRVTIEGGCYAC
jgi:hypothetical protein